MDCSASYSDDDSLSSYDDENYSDTGSFKKAKSDGEKIEEEAEPWAAQPAVEEEPKADKEPEVVANDWKDGKKHGYGCPANSRKASQYR